MFSKKKGIIIKENKQMRKGKVACFTAFYGYLKGRGISYRIIDALKQDRDLIMLIDGAMLPDSQMDREDLLLSFLEDVGSKGLLHRKKTASIPDSRSLLGIFIPSAQKMRTVHQLLVYIPHSAWKGYEYPSLPPLWNAWYYLCKEPGDQSHLLDGLFSGSIPEQERHDYFDPIIFDNSALSQMGIYTCNLSLDELRSLINR